jgi:hypothetical protein
LWKENRNRRRHHELISVNRKNSVMTAEECRTRARACRIEAHRSWGELRSRYQSTAQRWDDLADYLERRERIVALVLPRGRDSGEDRR